MWYYKRGLAGLPLGWSSQSACAHCAPLDKGHIAPANSIWRDDGTKRLMPIAKRRETRAIPISRAVKLTPVEDAVSLKSARSSPSSSEESTTRQPRLIWRKI